MSLELQRLRLRSSTVFTLLQNLVDSTAFWLWRESFKKVVNQLVAKSIFRPSWSRLASLECVQLSVLSEVFLERFKVFLQLADLICDVSSSLDEGFASVALELASLGGFFALEVARQRSVALVGMLVFELNLALLPLVHYIVVG